MYGVFQIKKCKNRDSKILDISEILMISEVLLIFPSFNNINEEFQKNSTFIKDIRVITTDPCKLGKNK